ncbi:hypothetical protein [Streptomyces colonosanans]|uniref:Secreted protein n=1 Tax=Streptomyces colonosanans TaxID=1428652 RepID=A0A1S2PEF2_9ACTN|nr:hypothetical protein [Streptomyces colonosanans]OIJ92040.1 hypothetical protein BIV24_14890 [Streptomyces colonosanans]
MSPAPQHPRTARRYAWLRVLSVLVALLLAAGTHAEAVEDGSFAVSTAQACDAEHDALATALRPAGLSGHRTLAPPRPVPRLDAWPPSPPDGLLLPAPGPAPCSSALYALRTVVLLC